jgi:hypothetical protein
MTRTTSIHLRLTAAEAKRLGVLAKAADRTPTDYLRWLIRGQKEHPAQQRGVAQLNRTEQDNE